MKSAHTGPCRAVPACLHLCGEFVPGPTVDGWHLCARCRHTQNTHERKEQP